MHKPIAPVGVRPSRPYTPGIVASGHTLYISGQGAITAGQRIVGNTYDETLLTLQNVERIVVEAGGTRSDIVSCRVILADLADVDEMDRAFREFFDGSYPTRTTIGAQLLREMKVEIDATAVIASS